MFLFFMLLSILGIISLIAVLSFFTDEIIRGNKSPYAWFILVAVVFFLAVAFWR